jgi:branched-chain amino acid transport system ATP-binding protein
MLLNVEKIDVSYGSIKALHEVSVQIERGEIVTLIGSNGAGKTTLLRTISGLLRPTAGSIVWEPTEDPASAKTRSDAPAGGSQPKPTLNYYSPEAQLVGMPAYAIVRLGISHVPEGRQVIPSFNVRDNLLLGAFKQTNRAEVQADLHKCFEMFPVLAERASQRAGTLSGGEQQMLAIARALMARPRLLLLDEPSLGLAPLIVRKIFQIIREINQAGMTIFLVEQNARMALGIANRGYVLQTGRVILADTAKNLLQNPQVQKAYLGG